MASKVDVCNAALGMLGATRITSLTDSSENARTCNEYYDFALAAFLEHRNWPGFLDRAALAELTDTPAFGWAAQYQLPSDFVRVVKVMDTSETEIDYVREGSKILCNTEDTIYLSYVAHDDDPTLLSPKMAWALGRKLAALIAYKITKSRDMAEQQEKLFAIEAAEAGTAQAEQQGHVDQTDPWTVR